MTRIVAIPLGYIMNLLYGLLGNYALTIIIFTVIIRLLIMPLYAMQLKSTEQMQKIQPEIKEIQTKYRNDPAVMQEKLQAVYAENKIRPALGCLPLLIQLPIIWGLFALLRNPTTYIHNPDMVLAAHESFFWVRDLSQPDLWILPIIAGIATYVSMRFTTAMSSMNANQATNGSMKAMQYFMPVMIVWMGRTLPAGLCMYWIISYLFQIIQTKIMRSEKKGKTESGTAKRAEA